MRLEALRSPLLPEPSPENQSIGDNCPLVEADIIKAKTARPGEQLRGHYGAIAGKVAGSRRQRLPDFIPQILNYPDALAPSLKAAVQIPPTITAANRRMVGCWR